jgi:energy-coupling factor transporter ATP-binding protein EcfA2
MSSDALKKLTIEHFRGAVQPFVLTFEKGKTLTVIYGENGTGKSTICDALDFLGKGQVGSLANRGLGKTNAYWHSLGNHPADVAVTLETTNGTCRATVNRAAAKASPPDQRPRVEVLRRAQILSLLEAKPADRYTAISRFIDVSGVEESEYALKFLIQSIEQNLDIALARVQENRDSISQFWERAGRPASDALRWAEKESRRDESALDLEVDALGYLQISFERLLDYPPKFKTAQYDLESARAEVDAAQVALNDSLAQAAQDSSDVVDLLEIAQSHLTQHPHPAVCPLCGSPERVTGLAERVNARLESFEALRRAQAAKRTRERALQEAEQRLSTFTQMAQDHAREFQIAIANDRLPPGVSLPVTALPSDPLQWSSWLSQHSHLLAQWKQAETERLDKKQFRGTLQLALETLHENTMAHEELAALLPLLKRALEIVREERRSFTDSTLAHIASEVGRMYELVHPGEGIAKITLGLDPNKRASLEIGASFPGVSDAPPQAYFSDSHLDTLGLCTFLALAAMDAPQDTILVLDDILGSVDEPHVDRLIGMLYEETRKFHHCVITTHYRPWREKFRWGWLPNGQCHFVDLQKWSMAGGMSLLGSIPDISRLRLLLREPTPDPQLVVAKAGVILEAALDFLTLLYECAVPRRFGDRYTLGDLLPAIDRKLVQALAVEILESMDGTSPPRYIKKPIGPYLQELQRISQVRNVMGAHFNGLSYELLDADALTFGHQVLELMHALMDEDVGWPRNGKSGCYWATTGETRRLYPYKKPS